MNNNDPEFYLTEIALQERIAKGSITKIELAHRAKKYFHIIEGNVPIKVNGKFGCPVCLSILSQGNNLVREDGYIVCDYCVPYVEESL